MHLVFLAVKSTAGEKKSVFDLGEITRMMKYPNVGRTFLVKSVGGLPGGGFYRRTVFTATISNA